MSQGPAGFSHNIKYDQKIIMSEWLRSELRSKKGGKRMERMDSWKYWQVVAGGNLRDGGENEREHGGREE